MNRALEEASGDYLGDRVAATMEKKLGQPAESSLSSTTRAAAKKAKIKK